MIREHDVPALIVHVPRRAEPLRSNFAAKDARSFNAILGVVGSVARGGRGRGRIRVKLRAKRVDAGVTDDAFDRGYSIQLCTENEC